MAEGHADPLRTSDLRLCKVVYDSWSYIIDSYRMQLKDTRAQSIFKNLRFKVLLGGILYTYDIMIYINNGYYMQLKWHKGMLTL